MQTTYDWRIRGRTLQQTDIPNPPIRSDVTLVGGPQERKATFRYLYRNGYLTCAALQDAKALFEKEKDA